ncbi:MAG TPA: hypothetical protein VNI77_04410 [Nitrososphaera sp.]|nr:hypothetical protein [Nitrososphaera sp.]
MDARVRKAILDKINETVSNASEISEIVRSLGHIPVGNRNDFALGVAIGRVYNSFHYQTRRTLKRNATKEEFNEFLDILADRAVELQEALKQQ